MFKLSIAIAVLLIVFIGIGTGQSTAQPLPQNPSNNFLPDDLQVITAENAHLLEPVGQLGKGEVYSVVWSPDSHYLAVQTNGSGLWIYDAENFGKPPILVTSIHSDTAITFSFNGSYFLFEDSDQTFHIWNLTTNSISRSVGQNVTEAIFSSDSSLIAVFEKSETSGIENTLRIIEIATGENQLVQRFGFYRINLLGFNLASTEFYYMTQGTLSGWDLTTGMALDNPKLPKEIVAIPPNSVDQVGDLNTSTGEKIRGFISPNKRYLAVSEDFEILIWDIISSEIQYHLTGYTVDAKGTVFSQDGLSIFTNDCPDLGGHGCMNYQTKQWDLATGQEIPMPDALHSPSFYNMWLHSDEPPFALIYNQTTNAFEIWDIEQGIKISNFQDADYVGESLIYTFSPDQHSITFANDKGVVRRWDFSSDSNPSIIWSADNHYRDWANLHDLKVSPNQQWLALSRIEGAFYANDGTYGVLELRDFATGDLLFRQYLGKNWADHVAFSPDSRTLALGVCIAHELSLAMGGTCASAEIRLLEIPEAGQINHNQVPRILSGYTTWIPSMEFSPNGQILATGNYDGTVWLWDATTDVLLNQLPSSSIYEHATSATFNNTGTLLATDGNNGVITLWGVRDTRP